MSSFTNIFHMNGLLIHKCLKGLLRKYEQLINQLHHWHHLYPLYLILCYSIVLKHCTCPITMNLFVYICPRFVIITLANSINCLNHCSKFPVTVRSIRILLFYTYPNYVPPNWPMVLYSLSTFPQLSSLRVFIKDHIKFIKQLRDCILLFFDKQPYYSIEKDECGLIMWF
jgi:hypothetical protein